MVNLYEDDFGGNRFRNRNTMNRTQGNRPSNYKPIWKWYIEDFGPFISDAWLKSQGIPTDEIEMLGEFFVDGHAEKLWDIFVAKPAIDKTQEFLQKIDDAPENFVRNWDRKINTIIQKIDEFPERSVEAWDQFLINVLGLDVKKESALKSALEVNISSYTGGNPGGWGGGGYAI
jgi:hypothetical protein